MPLVLEIITFAITVALLSAGLTKYINLRADSIRKEVKEDTEKLHVRIDDVHSRVNDVRDNYVRADHLKDLLESINRSVQQVYDEMHKTNNRIDETLALLASRRKHLDE